MGRVQKMTMNQRVAVIGAGLAGASLARLLPANFEVSLFDKGRGPSGRLATRRLEGFEFDHGAQFFTSRSPQFQDFIAPFVQNGLIAEWKPKITTFNSGQEPYKRDWFEPHWVPVPGMNAWVKELLRPYRVECGQAVTGVHRQDQAWWIDRGELAAEGPFDWVVFSCPAPQTAQLMPTEAAELRGQIGQIELLPCFALMLGFAAKPAVNWDAAVVQDGPLSWLAWNQSKPGRSPNAALVVHSSNHWADQNFERPLSEIEALMKDELSQRTGIAAASAVASSLHRWRFSIPVIEDKTDRPSHYIDSEHQIAICGDWCHGNRAQSAFLSASSLANALC